jgi:hypothetical protein
MNAECGDWKAWHDRMPGATPTLHVTAACTFPTTGYSVELRPQEPSGINPKDYLLKLIVHEPSGPVSEVITSVPLHYEESAASDYETVSILPSGPTGIPVEPVS